MPALWMPGATRLDVGGHAPTDGGPAKAIAHITWDRNASAAKPADLLPYKSLQDWFGRNPDGIPSAPHILWNPFTGEFTQFLPADSRSKSLADEAGGTRTNRAGSVVLQVETLFFPYCRVDGRVYARLTDTPCKGWQELLAWVRSWGVPDRWPMGRPTDFTSRRSESIWESQAGWYAHAHVPENDHQDPGSWPAFAKEEDMATPAEIAAAVWNHAEPNPVAGGAPVRMGAVQRYMDYVHGKQTAAIEAVPATVLTPEQVTAVATQAATQVAGSAALVEAIAEKVAAKLAARLAQ